MALIMKCWRIIVWYRDSPDFHEGCAWGADESEVERRLSNDLGFDLTKYVSKREANLVSFDVNSLLVKRVILFRSPAGDGLEKFCRVLPFALIEEMPQLLSYWSDKQVRQ